jgi:hypothetical protein
MLFLRNLVFGIVVWFSCSSLATNQTFHFDPIQEELSGTLDVKTFPGLPNYESIAKGDEAEEGFYLRLDNAIDVVATAKDANWETEKDVKVVQLILDDDFLKELEGIRKGTHLLVKGKLSNWLTGHHHEKILLEVEYIQRTPKS